MDHETIKVIFLTCLLAGPISIYWRRSGLFEYMMVWFTALLISGFVVGFYWS